ncbi:MAG TPA: hypothetical protein VGO52_06055 [Hyphomonadaceae bacterium]|jgi:hypothetical protein|nr:hypothetical protein [Hyphomonadaceae bacterium]
MKKYFLTASLVAGVSMIAAPAMAQATGYVGASYGQFKGEASGTDADSNVGAIEGVVSFPVSTGLVIQGGLNYANVDGDLLEATVLEGSAHLGYKASDYAVGAYVGLSQNDATDLDTFWFGGEYVKYFNQFTLSGAVAVGSIDDADADLVGVGGEGRYFVSDNLRIDGRLGWSKLETSGSDADGLNFGIGGEWKPDNFPISFTAAIDRQSLDLGTSDIDLTTMQVGIRFDFGAPTLKARDRSGPSFKTLGGVSPALGKVF